MEGWFVQNWFTVLSAAGIIGTLLFGAKSVRDQTKTGRIANLLTLTQSHRELWSQLFSYPALARILDKAVDLEKQPIALDEKIFVNEVILHLNSAFQAMKSGLVIKPEAVREDVGQFFSLPIPHTIWEKSKKLQNDDFVEFVESALK